MNKVIRIKTNLLVILLLFLLALATGIIYLTNGLLNLAFSTLKADSVVTVEIHEQFGERSATLSEADIRELGDLLQQIRLRGKSVRLYIAESMNPQYTIYMKFGIRIDVSYYKGYYIVNGRGYPTDALDEDNGRAILEAYLDQLANRSYFPREE